jgi:hypothetical protein
MLACPACFHHALNNMAVAAPVSATSSMQAFIESLNDSRFSVLLEAIGALLTSEFVALSREDLSWLLPSPASRALAVVLVKLVRRTQRKPERLIIDESPEREVVLRHTWLESEQRVLCGHPSEFVPGVHLSLDQFFASSHDGVIFVELAYCRMRDSDVPVLLRHLEHLPELEVLDVSYNRLTLEGIRALLPLADRASVKALVLYGNKPTLQELIDATASCASKTVLLASPAELKGHAPHVEAARKFYDVTLLETLSRRCYSAA